MGQHQPGIHREIKEELVLGGHRFHPIYAELAQRTPATGVRCARTEVVNRQPANAESKVHLAKVDRRRPETPAQAAWRDLVEDIASSS